MAGAVDCKDAPAQEAGLPVVPAVSDKLEPEELAVTEAGSSGSATPPMLAVVASGTAALPEAATFPSVSAALDVGFAESKGEILLVAPQYVAFEVMEL